MPPSWGGKILVVDNRARLLRCLQAGNLLPNFGGTAAEKGS
jgi:hypothetical protein